jgi:acyl carrier protein
MKDMTAKDQTFTGEEIFAGLKEILYEVAPYKIIGEVTPEKSLVKDFTFDSIDTMGMLLKVQERFLQNRSIIDVDQFINQAFKGSDGKSATVNRICTLIGDIIHGSRGVDNGNGKEN